MLPIRLAAQKRFWGRPILHNHSFDGGILVCDCLAPVARLGVQQFFDLAVVPWIHNHHNSISQFCEETRDRIWTDDLSSGTLEIGALLRTIKIDGCKLLNAVRDESVSGDNTLTRCTPKNSRNFALTEAIDRGFALDEQSMRALDQVL